ncbi:MAG TPA: NlpC/P60 family protein [Patescibacteria group bacterium]
MNPQVTNPSQEPSQWPPAWFNFFLVLVLLFALLIGLAMSAFFVGERQRAVGENVAGSDGRVAAGSGTGSTSDCSGVASVPTDLRSHVRDAAQKHLGGDEAALIALIQIESSWVVTAKSSGSSAAGLGQFTNPTARDYKEFVGGSDNVGITWAGGVVYDSPSEHSDDARFDAKRSIYATAHKLKVELTRFGTLEQAYIEGYHTHTTAAQLAEAQAGAARLMDAYKALKNGGGCTSTETNTSGGSSSTSSSLGTQIVADARKYIGQTTQVQADGENIFQCDAPTRSCASFVSTVLLDAKAITFHEKGAQALWDRTVSVQQVLPPGSRVDLSQLQPGDIVWFGSGRFQHVGVYSGNGRVIHTSSIAGKPGSYARVAEANLSGVADSMGGAIAAKRFK